MKKLWLLLILLIPFKIKAISAQSYIVIDKESNRVLEGSNYKDSHLIASTSKIMTALIALEQGDLRSKVIVDKDVLKAYGSNIYIEMNEEITLEDLLYGLMLRSGNDAAIEIANTIAGSMDNFVGLMNNKAKDLGMNNTNFINSSGLEDETGNGNTSTAYDMAILMSYALNNKEFRKIIGTKRYTTKTNYKTYDWYNKNKLLNNYEYCIGGKTGFTKKARRTLVTAAKKEDKTVVIVTLNDGNDFQDHEDLYEKTFNRYNRVKVLSKKDFKVEDNVFYDDLYIENDIYVLLTKNEEKKLKIDYEVEKLADYHNGDVVGEVVVKLGQERIAKVNIYAKKEIEIKKDFWSKVIDFLIFWN